MDTPRVPDQQWNPQQQLQELMLESQFDDHDAAATTARILREYGAVAAYSIGYLATYGGNERVRLQAATYIMDRIQNDGLDADIRLLQEQQKLVGQSLFAAIRALGQEFGFTTDDIKVRAIVHRTLISVSEKGGGELPPAQ
jgi:hypothetical protein